MANNGWIVALAAAPATKHAPSQCTELICCGFRRSDTGDIDHLGLVLSCLGHEGTQRPPLGQQRRGQEGHLQLELRTQGRGERKAGGIPDETAEEATLVPDYDIAFLECPAAAGPDRLDDQLTIPPAARAAKPRFRQCEPEIEILGKALDEP